MNSREPVRIFNACGDGFYYRTNRPATRVDFGPSA